MNINEILENIQNLKEKSTIELKKASSELPKSFWETYSSFANTKGGYIILGIDEQKEGNIITGVTNPEKIETDLWNMMANPSKVSFCTLNNEDVRVERVKESKSIIIIKVNEAPLNKKPIFLNNDLNRAYLRTGDGDRLIKKDEILMMARNSSPQMDSLILDNYSIADLDPISVTSFKEKVSIRYSQLNFNLLSPEDFLLEIGVLRKNRDTDKINLTRGGLLFLGNYNSIKEVFPSYHLDYFNLQGNNERWSDRIATDEPHPQQMNIYNFYEIVREKLSLIEYHEFNLNGQQLRIEKPPFDIAIREALVNTLAHADYDLPFPSLKIEIYDGWMKFINPGTMLISLEDYIRGGKSYPRNDIIMKLFRLLGASERQGFGGPQIFKSAKANDFRLPELKYTLESTELKYWTIDLADSYPEMNNQEKQVFKYILKNDFPVSRKQIEKELDLNTYQVRTTLESLLMDEKIDKIGNGPSTKYSIKMDSTEMLTKLQIMMDNITGIL